MCMQVIILWFDFICNFNQKLSVSVDKMSSQLQQFKPDRFTKLLKVCTLNNGVWQRVMFLN